LGRSAIAFFQGIKVALPVLGNFTKMDLPIFNVIKRHSSLMVLSQSGRGFVCMVRGRQEYDFLEKKKKRNHEVETKGGWQG